MKNQEEQFQIAWEMLDQGRCKAALNLYVSLPWNESKFLGVLRGLTEIGRYKEASEVADRGLAQFPLSNPLWIGKGNLSLRIDDYLTALKCFETALIVSPQDSSPLYGKALALENLGEIAKAVTILDALIEQYPDDSLFVTEKAHCFSNLGYPMDALKLYQQAMGIWYCSGEFHDGVALFTGICSVCIDLGLNEECLQIARKAIKALPTEHPLLYYNIGRAYLGMGMTQDAIATLKKGLDKFPSDKDLLDLLSEIQGDDDSPKGGADALILITILAALIARRRIPKK